MANLAHIAEWTFNREDDHVISDTAKVTAIGGVGRLRLVQPAINSPGLPDRVYSTDDDLYVRTKQFTPGSLVTWQFIEIIGSTPEDQDAVAVTSLSMRLYTGAEAQYWNGSAWVTATAGNWNTLADFNTNLPTYTGASIAFEIRLKTTDVLLTPAVKRVKLKWYGLPISFFNEWVFETVVASMKSSMRPTSVYTISAPGGTTIDLDDYPFDAGFVVTDIVSVFDETNDPTHATDLFSSYNSGTNEIALTSAIAAGDTAWVIFRYSPQIAVTTSSDYTEESKVPAIWLTGVRNPTTGRRTVGGRGPSIMDRSADPPEGAAFPNPIPLLTLDITYAVLSPESLDLLKLNEALIHWIETHPTLLSPALDTSVRLRGRTAMDWNTGQSSVSEPRFLTGTFSLVDVPLIGDLSASAADGSNTSTAGAIEAGDPNHPGIGYGVKAANLTYRVTGGTTTDALSIID